MGHAAQVVAERAVVAGLGGYSVGGLLERNAQMLFGFNRLANPPVPVLAYACGIAATEPARRYVIVDASEGRIKNRPIRSLLQRFRGRKVSRSNLPLRNSGLLDTGE